jgi:HK97 family phage prohead protease
MTSTLTPDIKTEREEFHVDIPFTKAVTTEKGDLELVGYASTWVKDRDGERIDPHAFDDTIEEYLSKNPIVLWQHNHDCPLGSIKAMEVDENGLKVTAIIPKPADGEAPWAHTAYSKIAAGIVKTFSIGGYFERELRPPADSGMFDYDLMDIVIVRVDLYETSCVSVPANADSIYEAARKAFGDSDPAAMLDDRRRAALKQVEQLLGMKDVTDPELVGMNDEEREERFHILIKGWDDTIGIDDYRIVEALVEEKRFEQAKPLATALNDSLYLPTGTVESTKAGRVLSKSNQGKLEKAAELLGEVLGQVHEAPEVDASELSTDSEGGAGDGAPKTAAAAA